MRCNRSTVDVDNFLQNPDVLRMLLQQNKTLVAPMLNSLTMYSNFWAGVNAKGYYKRTPEYVLMLKRNMTGLFEVPMIHSTYLINLRHRVSDELSYVPSQAYIKSKKDVDDMLTFRHSAETAGIPMYILNTQVFGKLLPPPGSKDHVYDEAERLLFLRMEAMIEEHDQPLPVSSYISDKFPEPDKMGFDEIYMINLVRRPNRRRRMMLTLKELGIAAKPFDAIDGKAMTTTEIERLGIDMLPGYLDPGQRELLQREKLDAFSAITTFGKRPAACNFKNIVTCFNLVLVPAGCDVMYRIIVMVVEKGYEKILIIEDDVRFEYKFRAKMFYLEEEISQQGHKWDLIYVGRKILNGKSESYLNGSKILVHPSYSYWTLSYMLTLEGAKKLLAQKPLGRMVPVDEYLPIMYNKHPREEWSKYFEPRDLVTYSVNPLFVFPTHYTGEPNYISDTETSGIWEEALDDTPTDESAETTKDGEALEKKDGEDKVISNGTNSQSTIKEEKELRNVPSVEGKEDSVKESVDHTEL
ncbi:putative procollagen galactosyltransferase 1 isoform X2 [Apostichopus japonicus]|uniref:Putative procollagen galactosyltransferase 1 isoform X2 n=1 Tax=Stichopus japonicus TaxID=307972 RepID=A0A2G8LP36_STIJA|nr:putative procollagen galactosyltransferase 1 isoform X2 [Apostichopus japonicus]